MSRKKTSWDIVETSSSHLRRGFGRLTSRKGTLVLILEITGSERLLVCGQLESAFRYRPSLSGSNSKGNVTSKMRSHVERFTACVLSYDSDFLNAFVGKSEAL